MTQDEQQLARLRAAFAAPDAAPAPESCPSPETIWSAVRGELPPQQLREVLDHVASCAACAEDWRLAAELNRQQAAEVATAPGKVIQGRFGWRSLSTAAAIAAALLIGVSVYRANEVAPGQQPTYREAEAPHAGIRSLLPPGEGLPRQGAVLRWSPLPGAVSYDVEVSTEDLQPVAAAKGQTTPEFRIPDSALAALPPGARLLWRIEAVHADGSRESSQTFTSPLR
jgi:hypothetical protein